MGGRPSSSRLDAVVTDHPCGRTRVDGQEAPMTNTSSSPRTPLIVLVHGAFAESSSWNGLIRLLLKNGHRAMAVGVPPRGLRSDAAYLASVLSASEGELVLVGHSYGGAVMSNAATGND